MPRFVPRTAPPPPEMVRFAKRLSVLAWLKLMVFVAELLIVNEEVEDPFMKPLPLNVPVIVRLWPERETFPDNVRLLTEASAVKTGLVDAGTTAENPDEGTWHDQLLASFQSVLFAPVHVVVVEAVRATVFEVTGAADDKQAKFEVIITLTASPFAKPVLL